MYNNGLKKKNKSNKPQGTEQGSNQLVHQHWLQRCRCRCLGFKCNSESSPFCFLVQEVSSHHALRAKCCPSCSALQCLFCPWVLGCTEMEIHRKAHCCTLWCGCSQLHMHNSVFSCGWFWGQALQLAVIFFFFVMFIINKPSWDATLSPQVV